MQIISTILSFVAAIMILVFIHEYGHFKIARMCGIKVRRFSIGFGKPFFTRVDRHGTEWAIAPFPLGGYVSMVDSRIETLAPGEEAVAFDKKALWKRSAVVLAGPLANLVFAWAAWSMLLSGPAEEMGPYLGAAIPGSAADAAGFKPKDKILSVDGSPVRSLSEVHMAIINDALSGKDATVAVENGKNPLTLPLSTLETSSITGPEGLRAIGFANPAGARMPATIKSAIAGSPAEKAGLGAGDSIVAIDGVPIGTWSEMGAIVNSSAGKTLTVEVKNLKGEIRTVNLSPAIPSGSPDKIAKIGAMLESGKLTAEQKAAAFVKIDRGAMQAMTEAASRCVKMTKLTFTAIGSMFSGRSGSENISGPVGIAKQAGEAADNGAQSFLGFLAFLSLSLFIMNLLPLPALDGGHLVLFALEALMGRPLSAESQARFGQVGFSLLAGLMLFALYNDISKLFH